MARVFLSYDREDASRAKRVALALEKEGHKVWWDRHIKAGSQYSREIEQALNGADAVVVLWSARSIDSPWVRDEAAAGRDRNRLVPVLIEACEPPLGFRQFQNIDLSRWKGRGKPDELAQLLDAMPTDRGESIPAAEEPRPARQKPSHLRLAWLAILAIVLAAGAYAGFRFLDGSKSSQVPTVAVIAANNSGADRDWARDVLVGLGGLDGAASRSFQLVDASEHRPDLVIEVAGAAPSQEPRANLVLRSTVDRTLLWSREIQRPRSDRTDLRREVVSSAALILQCAQDAASGDQPLRPALLKDYLSGCWEQLGSSDGDLRRMAGTFLKVTEEAPKFERAWAGLLYAESELVRRSFPDVRESLVRHIAQARQVNPRLAEAYLAEAALLPPNDVAGRIRLADEAVERDAGNALVLMQRSYEWTAVGRMTDAVSDGYNAVHLQPLSPTIRDVHVYALQAAGQFDQARKEIEEVERLWPGTPGLWVMRMRSAYPLGDIAEAEALFRSAPGWRDKLVEEEQEALLQARKNPTERNIDIAVEKSRSVMRKWARQSNTVFHDLGPLAVFGRTDEMFATMGRLKNRPDAAPFVRDAIFRPMFRDFWRDPRSMRVAQQLGVLEYWRKSGNWPDFCYEADHPYDCRAEAAKL